MFRTPPPAPSSERRGEERGGGGREFKSAPGAQPFLPRLPFAGPGKSFGLDPTGPAGPPHLRPKSRRVAAVGLRNAPAGAALTKGRLRGRIIGGVRKDFGLDPTGPAGPPPLTKGRLRKSALLEACTNASHSSPYPLLREEGQGARRGRAGGNLNPRRRRILFRGARPFPYSSI